MKSPFKYFRVDAKGFLTDPLLNTSGRRGDYASLMALAKVINCNGHFLDEFDMPLSLFEIKKRGRVSHSGLTYFVKCGKLVKKDGSHYLKNWPKYQDNYDRRGDNYKQKPQKDSEGDNDSREPLKDSEEGFKPPLGEPKNDSEITPSVPPKGGFKKPKNEREQLSAQIEDLYHLLDKKISDKMRDEIKTKLQGLEEKLAKLIESEEF